MPTYFKLFIFFGVIFVVAGVATMMTGGQAESPTPTAADAPPEDAAPYISFEKYYQLTEGMTYDEAVGILGVDGDIIETEEEVGPDDELIEIITYQWFNADGSNMTATFRAGALESKYQHKLK